MLPKSSRLFLFAAVLASAHAKGTPGSPSTSAHGPGTCASGRIASVADAEAFGRCRTVTGDLTIEGTDLTDLGALSELRAVTGALTIRNNANLRSLTGLEHLERLTSLELRENGLYDTRGVEGLRRVETLVIANNRHLISLRGFRNLEHVDALFVSRNPRIAAQLGLFPALGRVEGAVLVHSNLGLSDHDLARLLARVSGRQS
ncbi:MAG TPA: hypothetical protein VNN72_22990 [Polyangiaceae bacterium]|nr:hypothetical protein [Polyangiaceae bacterium]